MCTSIPLPVDMYLYVVFVLVACVSLHRILVYDAIHQPEERLDGNIG